MSVEEIKDDSCEPKRKRVKVCVPLDSAPEIRPITL